ncbi:hypothetical protein LXL04_012586 [Taraxacum kok-saghyz]
MSRTVSIKGIQGIEEKLKKIGTPKDKVEDETRQGPHLATEIAEQKRERQREATVEERSPDEGPSSAGGFFAACCCSPENENTRQRGRAVLLCATESEPENNAPRRRWLCSDDDQVRGGAATAAATTGRPPPFLTSRIPLERVYRGTKEDVDDVRRLERFYSKEESELKCEQSKPMDQNLIVVKSRSVMYDVEVMRFRSDECKPKCIAKRLTNEDFNNLKRACEKKKEIIPTRNRTLQTTNDTRRGANETFDTIFSDVMLKDYTMSVIIARRKSVLACIKWPFAVTVLSILRRKKLEFVGRNRPFAVGRKCHRENQERRVAIFGRNSRTRTNFKGIQGIEEKLKNIGTPKARKNVYEMYEKVVRTMRASQGGLEESIGMIKYEMKPPKSVFPKS